MKTSLRTRRAFTLIELLVVIAIIGILIGLVVGMARFAGLKADRAKVQTDLQHIRTGVEAYRIARGSIPTFAAQTFVTNPAFQADFSNNVPGQYRPATSFVDPWGNGYVYRKDGQFQFSLWSRGPDSKDFTGDDINPESGMQ